MKQSHLTPILILLICLLCGVIIYDAFRIKKLNEEVIKRTYEIVNVDNEKNTYKRFCIDQFELYHNLSLFDKGLRKIFPESQDKEDCIFIIFPKLGCGACLTLLCTQMLNLSIDPKSVYIVWELKNKYLEDQIGDNYHNFQVDNAAYFSNYTKGKDYIVIIRKGRNNVEMMNYSLNSDQLLTAFLQQDKHIIANPS